ncbi:MAG TPA: TonB-dependent receptor plug domain-containing protein [Opitutaceae bacterium]|nr:TonB-dependent receptor plug domain-containing protein [Opitutaceae bacterium]
MQTLSPRHARTLGALSAACLLAPFASAQAVPPAPVATGERVDLSPFIIRAEDDTGYAPAETLSGTRLRASVKDVASAMTIVTADFMNDIGALTYNDVVNFMPSSSSYATNENDTNGNGNRSGTPFVVRGFRSDSLSTNFFSSFTPADAYNSSRLTFTRGPNSILFGIGNPGGALDVTTNKATLNRAFHRLDLRADSFDGLRGSIDANLPLVPNKAALRLDILHDDRGNNIKPSKNRRDSLYGALTFQPVRNGTLYAEIETTRLRQKLPRTYEPFDWINPWINANRPVIPTAQRTTATAGVEFLTANGYPLYIPGVGAMDWARMGYGARPRNRGAATNATMSISYGRNTPNRVLPLDRYWAGDADRVDFDNSNYTLIYQHKLAEGLHLELGAKHDHSYRENFDGNGFGFSIQVDPNAQLPNGRPNPNVGLPYNEQAPKWEKSGSETNQLRATLSYERDFRHVKVFGRGLGKFTLAGLYSNEATHNHLETLLEVNETPLPGSVPDLSDARNAIKRRWYFTPGGTDYFASSYAPIDENGIRSGWEPTVAPRNNFSRTASYVLAAQANLLDDLLALTAGLRRDESLLSQTDYGKDARGLYSAGYQAGTQFPPLKGVGRPYLVGAVVHAHRNFSLFYNRSTNYVAVNQSTRTLADELLPPRRGQGFDSGIKFALWGDRFTGSFDYFETSQQNINDTTIRGNKTNWLNAIWDAIDSSQRVDPAWGDVRAQRTRGIELQVVGNPTSNLRLTANVSRNINVLEDQGQFTFKYLAANYPLWLNHASRPVVSPDGRTVGDIVALLKQQESDDRLLIGIRQTRVYEWQANFVGRYQFDRVSFLKGFAVGTAYRWRNAPVIGFARRGTLLDPSRPFFGQMSSNLDGWIEYGRTFEAFRRKVRWNAQLRVQNLLDDRTILPWTAEDDGTGRMIIFSRRMPGARQFVVNSTFAW